ncbi:SRPBCC family protein [Phenylobacterium sp.]|uniref:SRPBCC family protein n=1 Tax=Phenylobacterium sp. TaxID=1871053 RepID=UPI0027346417|nr:SRPBCC family protein [Phenylobacterium sp.]MDP3852362.1 SRPBCC family protein [Phenylobacterium sp.]
MSCPPIEESVVVPIPPERAFTVFMDGFADWWPADYTYSGLDGLEAIGLGAAPGDFCYEIGPDGFRVDWGRTVAVEPGRRIAFLWQIGPDSAPQPDPAQASQVEITFAPDGDGGTLISLTHAGFERHGEGAADYRAEMASEYGWPLILDAFVGFARGA